MAKFGFSIRGVVPEEIIRKFQELAFETQAKVIDDVLEKGADKILNTAYLLAPVGKTGALRDNLGIRGASAPLRVGGLRTNSMFKRSIVTGTRRSMGIDPNATGYYPFSMEYGYRRANGVHVPARPFMRPAIKEHRAGIQAHMGSEIKRMVEKKIR